MDRNQEQVPAGIYLFFFWNRSGLESIFYLQEQEFLNLRLISFIKVFLQLIAQFSSNLLEKAWRTFRARRHFVIKPKKLTLSPNPNLNPNPSPNPKPNLNPNLNPNPNL